MSEKGSESKERSGRSQRRLQDETQELCCESFEVESKQYNVYVKENSRGKFIQVVEDTNGFKSRLNLPLGSSEKFIEKLEDAEKLYNETVKSAPQEEPSEDEDSTSCLSSDFISVLGKRMYMDLKKNKRGLFLRCSMPNNGRGRRTLALPAEGIKDLLKCARKVQAEFSGDEKEEEEPELPGGEEVRAERKRFYCDCGRNDRGSFVRISEVTSNYRSSVTVPASGLADFVKALSKMSDQFRACGLYDSKE